MRANGFYPILAAAILLMSAFAADVHAKEGKRSPEAKRDKLDRIAEETLEDLFAEDPDARVFFDNAYGYAVFDSVKVSVLVGTGGGRGVAVRKSDGARTYMKMGTVGLKVGAGGQKYRVILIFENEDTFNEFVAGKWIGDASANAVAGKAGKNAEATFRDGVAFYELTRGGLMLNIDVARTKYWPDHRLNGLLEK